MSIKNLKPRNGRFRQGYFDGYNPKKYVGNRPIVYRSSWELKFMHWCENRPEVKSWSSEPFAIPYETPDGKSHNYWIDFVIMLANGERWLVEIKPLDQVPLNEAQINLNPVMRKNSEKWKATIEFCKRHEKTKFKIVTEKFFNS